MYDSIDITNNKNLYNFEKLNKLISHKELLYNSILIYYILYNKFNNTLSDKHELDTYNLDDNINKLVVNNNVYNTYEADYKNIYDTILKKIDDLEAKIKDQNIDNDYDKIKKELEITKKKLLEQENDFINRENNNISNINNNINEYNELLKKNKELETQIEYLNSIISGDKNNNGMIISKYREDIEKLKNELLISTNRIKELNGLLKNYILNNSKNIEEIKILEKQIETIKIYKTENNERIKNLEDLLEECRKNKNDSYKKDKDEEQEKLISKYKEEINNLNESIENLKNEMKEMKNSQISETKKNEIKLLEEKRINLENLVKQEEVKLEIYEKEKNELNIKIKNLSEEILSLETKRTDLEKSLKEMDEQHKLMLISNNEKTFMNELDKNKKKLEKNYVELLSEYQDNKLEIDIDLKLKEKNEQENILKYLIDNLDIDKNELTKQLEKLINTNEMNNKIIENININIRKINNSKNIEEKEKLRLINKNLYNSLRENKIIFDELKKNTDIFLEENNIDSSKKLELWKTLFNILHINTGISLLNNVINNNENMQKTCKKDFDSIENVKDLLELYSSKIEILNKNYKNQKYFVDKLEKNNEIKEEELKKLKKMMEDLEVKKLYDSKYDKLYDSGIDVAKIESDITDKIKTVEIEDNIELNKDIVKLLEEYEEEKKELNKNIDEKKSIIAEDGSSLLEENKKLEEEKQLLIEQLKNLVSKEQTSYSKSLMEKDKEAQNLKEELEEYRKQIELDKKKMNDLEKKIVETEEELSKDKILIEDYEDKIKKYVNLLDENTKLKKEIEETKIIAEKNKKLAEENKIEAEKNREQLEEEKNRLIESGKDTTRKQEQIDEAINLSKQFQLEIDEAALELRTKDQMIDNLLDKMNIYENKIKELEGKQESIETISTQDMGTLTDNLSYPTLETYIPPESTQSTQSTQTYETQTSDTQTYDTQTSDTQTSMTQTNIADTFINKKIQTSPELKSEFEPIPAQESVAKKSLESHVVPKQSESPTPESEPPTPESPTPEPEPPLSQRTITVDEISQIEEKNEILDEIIAEGELLFDEKLQNYTDSLESVADLSKKDDDSYDPIVEDIENPENYEKYEKYMAQVGFIKHLTDNYEKIQEFRDKNKKYLGEYQEDYTETEDQFNEKKKKIKIIQGIICFIFLTNYNLIKFYFINKITQKYNKNEEDKTEWVNHLHNFALTFPMKILKNPQPPIVYVEDFSRTNIITIIKLHIYNLKKMKEGISNEEYIYLENIFKFFEEIKKEPALGNILKIVELLPQLEEIIKEHIEDTIPEFKLVKPLPGQEDLFNNKLYNNLEEIAKMTGLDSKKHLGGANINNLIEPSSIMELEDNKTLREFIDNLNNKFRELNEEFCINCDREQQLKKLNKVFNVNNMNENELYQKYNITVRDLLLCVYLNMIEYIENSLIKDKYKLTFIDTIETVINEHILYSIWFFIFSKYYVFEEFKSKINKGKCRIEEIIRYIRDKEKIKFSKINEEIYEKFYKNILTKFVYNIKINRDYYNLTNSSINEKNKYDKKYIKNKIRIEEIYKNLVNIINIKENIKIYSTYNKNIVNLLNSVIKIIIFYRNLYIYSNNICKFYSINNMRTKKEVKYNINNFSSYLNIQKFIKTHSIKNKKLMIDNEIIVCKSIKDFNKYINKLSKKVNRLNLDFITEKWDLVELKLKNMDIFTDFEIECIKLIIAFNYNNNLLKKTNKFIKNYNLYKKMFKKYLEKFDVEYKNITEYNYNIDNISSIFTGIEFKNLLKNKSCLGYI